MTFLSLSPTADPICLPTTTGITQNTKSLVMDTSILKSALTVEEHLAVDSDLGASSSSPNTSVTSSNDDDNDHDHDFIHDNHHDNGIVPPTRSDDSVKLFSRAIDSNSLSLHSDLITKAFHQALTQNSPVSMLPNYNIQPTGNEFGDYLVIDVGGSTLRVAVISIDPPPTSSVPSNTATDRSDRVHTIIEQNWDIVDSAKIIDAAFFKWIGTKITHVLRQQSKISLDSTIKTGITWSFPLATTSHNNGRINYVGKGYTISPEIYDHDLKQILESCMRENFHLEVDIKVIVNDSLAVYAAGTFMDKYTKLALVLGTGLNMCCALPSDKFHPEKQIEGQSSVLLNIELSLFGMSVLDGIANRFDAVLDPRFQYSKLPFEPHMETDPHLQTLFQPSELMTSGRYLPELTRLVLCELIDAKEIFQHEEIVISQELYQEYSGFTGELMCQVAETEAGKYDLVRAKLAAAYGWQPEWVTDMDIVVLKKVVDCVITRAAFIVATTVVGLIKLLQSHGESLFEKETGAASRPKHLMKIGYVGSVLLYFHSYRELILKYVNENEYIQALNLVVDFKLVEDSSIVGAAIGAAYYTN